MIYFIQSAQGPIKIGYARDPEERRRAMQVSCPYPLKIIGVMPGGKEEEYELHQKFKWFKSIGEWFSPCPELLSLIEDANRSLPVEPAKPRLLPKLERVLVQVGENIKLARLRRKLSAEMLAERADISRPTLRAVERGDAGVSMGVYANVLFCLQLEQDIVNLGKDDELGRKLQDIGLLRKRAPKSHRTENDK